MKKLLISLFVLVFISTGLGITLGSNKGDAAIIKLSGPIKPSDSSSPFSGGGISPENVRELNERALSQGADAIIYEINSGGGAIVASKEVYRSIDSVDVPTVCRMRDVAASGGYLIALGCDEIVADSATLTGSIGVKSSYLEYSGVMNRLGVEYVNISEGNLKEIGSPYKNITQAERENLESMIGDLHEEFVDKVASERNLSEDERREIASSEPYIGSEAKDLNIVDSIGGRKTALTAAENLTSQDLRVFNIESSEGGILSLITGKTDIMNLFTSKTPFKASIF